MSDATIWLGALAFLAFLTVGWGRICRAMTAKDEELTFLWIFCGGAGLLIAYGLVLGMTLEVIQ